MLKQTLQSAVLFLVLLAWTLSGCSAKNPISSAEALPAEGTAPESAATLGDPMEFHGAGFKLSIGRRGALDLAVAGDRFVIHSCFSYPDEIVGLNMLAEAPGDREHGAWQPVVTRSSPTR